MRFLTKPVDNNSHADFILITLDATIANWLVRTISLVDELAREQPTYPLLCLTLEDPQTRWLNAAAANYTELQRYQAAITRYPFVSIPPSLEIPQHVQTEGRDIPLDAPRERAFISIAADGVTWQLGVESYGRRILSSPLLDVRAIQYAAGALQLEELPADVRQAIAPQ